MIVYKNMVFIGFLYFILVELKTHHKSKGVYHAPFRIFMVCDTLTSNNKFMVFFK